MTTLIDDMPPGSLGFRVSGKLTREDYDNVLVPPLRAALDEGRRVRVLYAIGPDVGMERGALLEDLKLELEMGIKHRDMWERIAVVTDVDWLKKAFGLFSWMVPGEMRLFPEGEFDLAKAWLSEDAADASEPAPG